MIIDADCHISPTPEGGNSIEADELLRRMDRSGVDQAVAWLQPPYLRDVGPGNAYVHEAMRSHPDRILGFGWADPNLGVDRAKEAVHRCVEDYGLFGVKLNGAQNSFYIDSPELSLPVIEEIASLGARLAFHVGGDACEHTHPFRVGKIARQFPELTILAVHMGGAAFADLSDAMIEIARDCPNLHLIGSAIRAIRVLEAVRTLGADRVSFGSDTPFALMWVERAKYDALLDGEVSAGDRQKIMGGNVARLFGLDAG
jgi:predicted TIM-barrel fold metal-dependent hydrolase